MKENQAGKVAAMAWKRYPSDLSDAEWAILQPLLPPGTPGGRPRRVDLREVCNALCYVLRGGIPWRMLPKDFPPWQTVYDYFRRWRRDGTWERINDILLRRARVGAGRDPEPSAGVLDSQSAKTTEKGGHGAMTGARK